MVGDSVKRLAGLSVLYVMAGTPVFAGNLVITPTFSSAVDSLMGSNAGAFKSAFTLAASNFTDWFNDPIHVNIDVAVAPGTGTLGGSSTFVFSSGFTTVRNALVTDAKSGDDFLITGAGGSVAAILTDPLTAAHTYWVTKAQAKALNLIADDLTSDGTVTLGAGWNYDYNPADGITAGQFDIVSVFMHEISEVMGRIGLSGSSVGANTNSYTLLDLMSYKSAGTRGMLNDGGNFLSFDNGNTLLKAFNNTAALGGDSRDWASGSNDSFNAFGTTGVVNGLSVVDIRTMDAVGYDLCSPEPATVLLFGTALAGLGLLKRRTR